MTGFKNNFLLSEQEITLLAKAIDVYVAIIIKVIAEKISTDKVSDDDAEDLVDIVKMAGQLRSKLAPGIPVEDFKSELEAN